MTKPKVAFVVQRCTPEILGGSEALCFSMAKALAHKWEITLLTTCAQDYITWKNDLPQGQEIIDGFVLKRFEVVRPRDQQSFAELCGKLESSPEQVSDEEARNWIKQQGPLSLDLINHIRTSHHLYDKVIFFTYLYFTTFAGIESTPTTKSVLVPTAHDEWPIHMPVWSDWFSKPAQIWCLTSAEERFIHSQFPESRKKTTVVGAGMDTFHDHATASSPSSQKATAPFMVCLGRLDRCKGTLDLIDDFKKYRRSGGSLELVLAGTDAIGFKPEPGIRYLGRVSDHQKWELLSQAVVLVNPSPFESLSYVLLEAWSIGCPTLSNGHCEVMVEQSARSGCGLCYQDHYQFRAGLEIILQNPDLARTGPHWVKRNYSWTSVTDRWNQALLNCW